MSYFARYANRTSSIAEIRWQLWRLAAQQCTRAFVCLLATVMSSTTRCQPGSKYLAHVSPKFGSAEDITEYIFAFLGDKGFHLVAAGCDGTVTNTGHKSGVPAWIELHFHHNINCLACLLHANKLPLRHLISELDGKLKSSSSFPVPIGQAIHKCEMLFVNEFVPVEGKNLLVDTPDLSADQK